MRMAALITLVLLVGVGCVAAEMSITASKPYPDPDTEVSFRVEGAPEGSEFRWTKGEDGETVRTGGALRWTVPEGYHVLEVEVLRDGAVVGTAAYGVLADRRLGAMRTVDRKSSDRVEVQITVRIKETITGGLTLEERIPDGWRPYLGDAVSDGTLEPEEVDGKLVTGWWMTPLEPGFDGYLRYALWSDERPEDRPFLGFVVAYIHGERAEFRIGGDLTVR